PVERNGGCGQCDVARRFAAHVAQLGAHVTRSLPQRLDARRASERDSRRYRRVAGTVHGGRRRRGALRRRQRDASKSVRCTTADGGVVRRHPATSAAVHSSLIVLTSSSATRYVRPLGARLLPPSPIALREPRLSSRSRTNPT